MTAAEALEMSYLPFERIMNDIKIKAANQETCLPYVLISEDTRERLKELGYKIHYPTMDGTKTTIKWA